MVSRCTCGLFASSWLVWLFRSFGEELEVNAEWIYHFDDFKVHVFDWLHHTDYSVGVPFRFVVYVDLEVKAWNLG